jgi:hypothetical protein
VLPRAGAQAYVVAELRYEVMPQKHQSANCNCFAAHKYHDRVEFLADIELIFTNCILYNGPDSPFTKKAEMLLKTSQAMLDEVRWLLEIYTMMPMLLNVCPVSVILDEI